MAGNRGGVSGASAPGVLEAGPSDRPFREVGPKGNVASAYEVTIRKCSLIFLKAVDLTVPLARR
jgi:hypothetical protein